MHRADDLTILMCLLSWKFGSLNLLELSGPVLVCTGTIHLYLCIVYNYSSESRSGGEGMWLGTECFLYPIPSPKIRVNHPALSLVTIKKQHNICQYSQSLPTHFEFHNFSVKTQAYTVIHSDISQRQICSLCDFRLLPQCRLELHPSGLLHMEKW